MKYHLDEFGYVYFIDFNPPELGGEMLPITKVGYTKKKVNERKQEIQPHPIFPFDFELVSKIKSRNPNDVEDYLHIKFSEQGWHEEGEWFILPDKIIGWSERVDKINNVDEIDLPIE